MDSRTVCSAQGLIRALRAPGDPPADGGLSKIEIAKRAWENVHFLVPNKAEVVLEFILNNFLMEKANDLSHNSLLNVQYWKLLHKVISSFGVPHHRRNSRHVKAWLVDLLNRKQVDSILVSLLEHLESYSSSMDPLFFSLVSSSFDVIWPLAAQKLPPDAVLRCFGALLCALQSCDAEVISHLGSLVVASYRNAFDSSSNKKKLYFFFLQDYFRFWLQAIARWDVNESNPFKSAVYDAGQETLFNLDILRQTHISDPDISLFQAIKSTTVSKSEAFLFLPRMFTSYVEALRKYRGVLFGSSNIQASENAFSELQKCGMKFYHSCKSLFDGVDEPGTIIWKRRIDLLSLVNKEKLYNSDHVASRMTLSNDLDIALVALHHNDSDVAGHAMEVISALSSIDFDIVIPKLPQILLELFSVQKSQPSYSTFLSALLAYYTKTHKVNSYIEMIFSTFSHHTTASVAGGPLEIYRLSLMGPIFEATHLKHLSMTIQRFSAYNQTYDLVSSMSCILQNTWDDFEIQRHRGNMGRDHSLSIIFARSARFAAAVLHSIPLQSVPEVYRADVFRKFDAMKKTTQTVVRKSLKRLLKTNYEDGWSHAVLAAASIHLQYILDACGPPSQQVHDRTNHARLIAALEARNLFPELRLEIIRLLVSRFTVRERGENQAIIDIIFRMLENSGGTDSLASCELPAPAFCRTDTECRLMVFCMIMERWLPVIEYLASHEQLDRLASLILTNPVTDPRFNKTHFQRIVMQTLRSAHFWELIGLRGAFLKGIDQAVSPSKHDSLGSQHQADLTSVYRLLLLVPTEYVTRSSRPDLIKKALLADRLIMSQSNCSDRDQQDLNVLRNFVIRTLPHCHNADSIQSLCSTLQLLTLSENVPIDLETTLIFADSLFREVFKASGASDVEAVIQLLQVFGKFPSVLSSYFHIQMFSRMIMILEHEFTINIMPNELSLALYNLYETSTQYILGRTEEQEIDCQRMHLLCTIWSSLLSLAQWLTLRGNRHPEFGRNLALKVLGLSTTNTHHQFDSLLLVSFHILLQELHFCASNDRLPHLDLLVALYWSFSSRVTAVGCLKLDEFLSRTCKELQVSEFAYLLVLTSKFLTTFESLAELSRVTDLAGVLLRNHPTGTLHALQAFSAQCINTFAIWHGLIEAPIELRVKILHFVSEQCLERSGVLRLRNINDIWTLLSKFLSGTRHHDSVTTTSIFHTMVLTTSNLLRLRRDLVTLTLPHLAAILRQLISCVRVLRPDLGTRQSIIASDTQPRWLNARFPLGGGEARAISRLLEALTTKTTIRSNTKHADTSKAESLAKSFSKHAPSVLMAYVQSVNDPLCLLPLETRKELRPGLYALCGMIGEHTRDNIMASITDAGGKAVVKALWKDYEKQRYVGKG